MNMQQGSEEWLNFRKSMVTASEVSIIMGLNPWETPLDLFERKLGLKEDKPMTEAMARGVELEPIARAEFEAMTGIEMKPKVVIHPKYPWLMASLDGINYLGTKIVEIKCGGHELHEMAKKGEIPPYYNCQIQCQIACTGVPWAYYMSYRDGEGVLVEVERDTVLISQIIEAGKEFYRRMQEFDPPPPKHHIEESLEMIEAKQRYTLALDMRKRAEAMEAEAKQRILELADGRCIECDGMKVTHFPKKGAIDYSLIPQLQGVNLELYRKPPTQQVRITL